MFINLSSSFLFRPDGSFFFVCPLRASCPFGESPGLPFGFLALADFFESASDHWQRTNVGFVRLVFAGPGGFDRAPAVWKLSRESGIRDRGTNTNPKRERGAKAWASEGVIHLELPCLRVGLVVRVSGHLVGRDPRWRVGLVWARDDRG
jgi:hypothetical protein